MVHNGRRALILLAWSVFAIPAAQAQTPPRFAPMMITMRDGKALAADLYSIDTTVARPLIVIQTPYNKFLLRYTLGAPEHHGTVLPFDSLHYNYLTVDWRWFYESAGAASPGYDRGLDGYDIIEWAATQRWCNGKIGTWGVSALGLIQFETMKHHPPHLVCAMPMMKDYKTMYSDFFPGGVYKKEYTESLQKLGFLTTASILAHPTQDLYWTVLENTTDYPESVSVPVQIVGGWFDHFPDEVIRAFEDLRSRSAPAVRDLHKMIVGPWLHAACEDTVQGQLSFPAAVGVAYSAAQEFFDFYLRGIANGYASRPTLRYYQMGEESWKDASSWTGIANRSDTLFFANTTLVPARIESTGVLGVVFQYDPRSPSPAIGGPRFNPFDTTILVGPQDQRALVESRSDVLRYTTATLTKPLEIVGAPEVVLTTTSNRTDTDYSVRLCDVYPDGRSMLMTQGIRRLRFRDSYASPTLGSADHQYQIVIDLSNLALTILPGHALRLDVASTIYPQYDLNLNNGGTMYAAGDTLVAANGIAINSYVVIPARSTTSVNEATAGIPAAYSLMQNHPNPFNPSTVVSGRLPVASHVRIVVYDLLGREVAVLMDGNRGAGAFEVTWDASHHASGVYICRMVAEDPSARSGRSFVAAKKMVVMR